LLLQTSSAAFAAAHLWFLVVYVAPHARQHTVLGPNGDTHQLQNNGSIINIISAGSQGMNATVMSANHTVTEYHIYCVNESMLVNKTHAYAAQMKAYAYQLPNWLPC
jgi:hypothetical protein